ncbi:Glutamyl endopeptidase like protein [Verticillium longisporum]|uniref:Glutamyl endopeptidase like protein n=1 Tax=Verticillium longisporum TaxID=100787 RepID=A0A8I2ZNQ4_VERLO|nr:Glutamyl endopeptidase like protein [Verticillium longisporum]
MTINGINGANGTSHPDVEAQPRTRVYLWGLDNEEHKSPTRPEHAEALIHGSFQESVIGADNRERVVQRDFMPGGVYRAIVKLFLRFENQAEDDPWAMATGWLIRKDLLVTAGHCAYDHSHGLGRLLHVKAYIGYSGKESIMPPEPNVKNKFRDIYSNYKVEFRTGKAVMTTESWHNNGSFEAADLSFIQLSSGFEGVDPIKYSPTPIASQAKLGVIGYPGDLLNPDIQHSDEKGAVMWEMYLKDAESWDTRLSSSNPEGLLQYTIDTYGGNSGSPVLLERPTDPKNVTAIGVHVYGGSKNSASVIGPEGNVFEQYLSALDVYNGAPDARVRSEPVEGPQREWLKIFSVPAEAKVTPTPKPTPGPRPDGGEALLPGSGGPGTLGGNITGVEEGFLDFLNKAVNFVAPVVTSALDVALPIALGPVGVPVAALAGAALGAAGKLAARGAGGTEAEIGKLSQYAHEGIAERAVLGEAAIACLKHMGNDKCQQEGFFDSMSAYVKKLAPLVTTIGPKIVGAVAEPALRLALSNIPKPPGTESEIPKLRPGRSNDTKVAGFGPKLPNPNHEAFITTLGSKLTESDTEGFLEVTDGPGQVIRKGLRVHVRPLDQSIKDFHDLVKPRGTESTFQDPQGWKFKGGITERAILGEAALLTLMDTPVKKLEQEGLFDMIKSVVKTVGPVVIKAAPVVFKAVTPIVQNALADLAKNKGGSTEALLPPVNQGWPRLSQTERNLLNADDEFVNWDTTLNNENNAYNAVDLEASNAGVLAYNMIGKRFSVYNAAFAAGQHAVPHGVPNVQSIFGFAAAGVNMLGSYQQGDPQIAFGWNNQSTIFAAGVNLPANHPWSLAGGFVAGFVDACSPQRYRSHVRVYGQRASTRIQVGSDVVYVEMGLPTFIRVLSQMRSNFAQNNV